MQKILKKLIHILIFGTCFCQEKADWLLSKESRINELNSKISQTLKKELLKIERDYNIKVKKTVAKNECLLYHRI